MSGDDVFLTRDQATALPFGVTVVGDGERIGDCLVYPAEREGQRVRLIEYWPQGVVWRDGSGSPVRADGISHAAWDAAVAEYEAKALKVGATRAAGIVPILRSAIAGAGGTGRTAYVVAAEPGMSLERWLAHRRDVPPDAVRQVAAGVVDALLPRAGYPEINHLDISPATIFVGEKVRLGYFATDNRGFMLQLPSQRGLVRPAYSPVERYDGKLRDALGRPADVYGLCATLYRMIEGKAPAPWWSDTSPRTDAPLWAQLPPAFRAAVLKGLSKQPEDRFPDVHVWAKAMEHWPRFSEFSFAPAKAPPLDETGAGTAENDTEPSAPESSGSSKIPYVVVGLIAAGLAGAAYVGMRGDTPVVNNTIVEENVTDTNIVYAEPEPVVADTPTPTPTPAPSAVGLWRLDNDSDCLNGRRIEIDGDTLTFIWQGKSIEEQIRDRNDENGAVTSYSPDLEQSYTFEPSSDGTKMTMKPEGENEEVWVRCGPVRPNDYPNGPGVTSNTSD